MAESDIDELFSLPLTEFTAARNALASRLKKAGLSGEAERVKSLAKPSVSAWAVNQLYWRHRGAFDNLLETGRTFREAQASQIAGRSSDVRESRDARRNAISELSREAAALLQEGGHNPAPETMRRIASSLEAISAYPSLPEPAQLGRLSEDIDPPGFDALAALLTAPPRRQTGTAPPEQSKATVNNAAAETALAHAQQVLADARVRTDAANEALKAAAARTREADRQRREAEARYRKALASVDEAEQHEQRLAAEAEDAKKAVEAAQHEVEQASAELKRYRPRRP